MLISLLVSFPASSDRFLEPNVMSCDCVPIHFSLKVFKVCFPDPGINNFQSFAKCGVQRCRVERLISWVPCFFKILTDDPNPRANYGFSEGKTQGHIA